jgi:hypothetical protein
MTAIFRRAAFWIPAIVLVLVLAATAALATHSTWHHHHLHWYTLSGEYYAYSDVGASSGKGEYMYTRVFVEAPNGDYFGGLATECYAGTNYCPPRIETDTLDFPEQSGWTMTSHGCAIAGDHSLPGRWYSNTCPWSGIDTHIHSTTT